MSTSTTDNEQLNIAVVGCTHGELDVIFTTIQHIEQQKSHQLGYTYKIDLVLCCGDFQCCRNTADLQSMAVPHKYAELHEFYQYYNNTKSAPIPTVFIGGNHENSNYLTELYLGGYICPNIYYAGYSSILHFGGYNIACLSGIYKHFDYNTGYYERIPFNDSTKRSIYHTRRYQIDRFNLIHTHKLLNIDIFLSHDWPNGITQYGNTQKLLKIKPFFRNDIERQELGSLATMQLLYTLQPEYWFSAHLHVKYSAIVTHHNNNTHHNSGFRDDNINTNNNTQHSNNNNINTHNNRIHTTTPKQTKFLALDKCLPNRDWLQIIELPCNGPKQLSYTIEWLAILKATLPYMSMQKQTTQIPLNVDIKQHIDTIQHKLHTIHPTIDKNSTVYPIHIPFIATAVGHGDNIRSEPVTQYVQNPQTKQLLDLLDCTDPYLQQQSQIQQTNVVHINVPQKQVVTESTNDEEIDLDNI